jgi:superfamily II DNA helicase RecQ
MDGRKLNISACRQIAVAISRRYCRGNTFQSEDQGHVLSSALDEENIDNDPWDLQTSHSTHVAGMIYARELMEGDNVVIGCREKFRHVSIEWHKFFQLVSAGAIDAQKRLRSLDNDIQPAQMARWKQLQIIDIREELSQMLGDNAEFRELQKPALEAIMKTKSPILVVMGIGAGKSLLFQLPAHSQKSGTTVAIVPLKSLEHSLHERCHKAGISCIRWDPQQRGRMAQIVLVQPESAVSKTFALYLNKLQGTGQLDSIVIAECHAVLDNQPDFRPEMRKAGAVMLDRGVQMIYLQPHCHHPKKPSFWIS